MSRVPAERFIVDRLSTHVIKPWSPPLPGLYFLLACAAAGDVANFYITVSLVADEHPLVTVLVVLGLTAAAIGLAHAMGTALRQRRDHHSSRSTAIVSIMAGIWLLLGLAAAAVRWVAPPLASDGPVIRFGGDVPGAVDTTTVHHITSLLLLGLYVASGALAAWIAYTGHNPHAQARRITWRRLVFTGFRHRRRQARVERAGAVRHQHITEHDRLNTNHTAAVAEREALATELKAYARILIAGSLGDPVATEGLVRPRPSVVPRDGAT